MSACGAAPDRGWSHRDDDAIGLEAAGLAAAGVSDLLVATEIIGTDKLRAAAELARHVRLSIVVDSDRAVHDLARLPPIESISRAISWADRERVPLKTMCSTK